MLSAFLITALLALAVFALIGANGWRRRALDAKLNEKANREAHDIQNKVALDYRYRERVRREFDGP